MVSTNPANQEGNMAVNSRVFSKYETVRFTDRFTGRTAEGRFIRDLDAETIIVSVSHRAARGGSNVGTSRIVKRSAVIA